jgi:enoyl-CoA hydratase
MLSIRPVIVVSEVREGVVTVTLNRPERDNALSIGVLDCVSDALDALAGAEDVRCVVLTGTGDVFCAGFDLPEFRLAEQESDQMLWASSERFRRTVLTFPLPIVASVNGPALSGGFDLAVMCDVRVASTSARFAHPDRLRHRPPGWSDGVYEPLEALVGGPVARDLCFMGGSVDAVEASRLGLVSVVVEADELVAETERVSASIARAPRAELMHTKRQSITP